MLIYLWEAAYNGSLDGLSLLSLPNEPMTK